MKDPFLIIGYMLLGLMISFEINAQPSIYEIKQHVQNQPFDFEQISQDVLYFTCYRCRHDYLGI